MHGPDDHTLVEHVFEYPIRRLTDINKEEIGLGFEIGQSNIVQTGIQVVQSPMDEAYRPF
jgi:hypothetical protein